MVELTNKRTSYDVKKTTETLSLQGTCSIADNAISNFSGSFTNAEGTYVGSFYYSTNASGKISKNLSDMDEAIMEDGCKLIDVTVAEIKESI